MSVKPPSHFKLWKGKEKETEPADFDDLNPVITYRTLFAENLGVRDPLHGRAPLVTTVDDVQASFRPYTPVVPLASPHDGHLRFLPC
ncbi:hypothetical protein K438DRAFT_1962775 [Mycena galopus ATCC 62051]|nr:hypothetical protein K438DRAFT_1962775 [Mycena galopus ATCC 62051]